MYAYRHEIIPPSALQLFRKQYVAELAQTIQLEVTEVCPGPAPWGQHGWAGQLLDGNLPNWAELVRAGCDNDDPTAAVYCMAGQQWLEKLREVVVTHMVDSEALLKTARREAHLVPTDAGQTCIEEQVVDAGIASLDPLCECFYLTNENDAAGAISDERVNA